VLTNPTKWRKRDHSSPIQQGDVRLWHQGYPIRHATRWIFIDFIDADADAEPAGS